MSSSSVFRCRSTCDLQPRKCKSKATVAILLGLLCAACRVDPDAGLGNDGNGNWTAGDTRIESRVGGVALLRAVREARQDGFDRIVLEFEGAELPGYRISYIDGPVRQCGSGHTVDVAGDGWLEIVVEPADAHTEAGEPTVRERSRRPELPAVRQLELTCDFEAMVVWVAGVRSPEPYRVLELAAPTRLVVDVRHRGR